MENQKPIWNYLGIAPTAEIVDGNPLRVDKLTRRYRVCELYKTIPEKQACEMRIVELYWINDNKLSVKTEGSKFLEYILRCDYVSICYKANLFRNDSANLRQIFNEV